MPFIRIHFDPYQARVGEFVEPNDPKTGGSPGKNNRDTVYEVIRRPERIAYTADGRRFAYIPGQNLYQRIA